MINKLLNNNMHASYDAVVKCPACRGPYWGWQQPAKLCNPRSTGMLSCEPCVCTVVQQPVCCKIKSLAEVQHPQEHLLGPKAALPKARMKLPRKVDHQQQ